MDLSPASDPTGNISKESFAFAWITHTNIHV
jgi:hypothetical protein